LDEFVGHPQEERHHHDEGKYRCRHLDGFFASGPYHPADFVVGILSKSQEPTTGCTEPGDCDSNDATGYDGPDARDHGLAGQGVKSDQPSNECGNGQADLDAVGGIAYGLYARIRHDATKPGCGPATG